jgi:hypothetical protein
MAGPRLNLRAVRRGLQSIQIDLSAFSAVFPTKVGIQIHPVSWQGFTWAPTFVGETEEKPASSVEIDSSFR